jgi:hypothetical protein
MSTGVSNTPFGIDTRTAQTPPTSEACLMLTKPCRSTYDDIAGLNQCRPRRARRFRAGKRRHGQAGRDAAARSHAPISILALTNTASAAPVVGGGHICTPEYGENGQNWWCCQLEAVVTSEVPVNGVVREVVWTMTSVSLTDVVDEMHWRISNAELR